jgi:hypothetical protein
MVVLLVILGILLVGFLAVKVLGGGGGTSSSTPTTLVSPTVRSTTTTTAVGAAPTETFEVFATKNPFLPLKGATAGTTTGATAGTTGTTVAGTTGTTGTGTTGATGSTGSTASNQPTRSQRVSLLDVFVDSGKVTANVKVNDTVYKVTAGQVFATSFKAVSLSQATGCGQFLFGDDQFRICKGEQVLK